MVDVPDLVHGLKRTPQFEWCLVGRESRKINQKDMLERDWTMCPKFVNHSRHNSWLLGGPT